MSSCIDPKLGKLLHDYELGLLPDEDKHKFEMHLYDCDYCLAQVREFMDVSEILTRDPDVRTLAEKIAGESETKKEKRRQSPFIKLLIAAVLVVVIAVPIYHYGIYDEPSDATQTLEFLPSRIGGSDIIYLEKGGYVAISFYIAEDYAGPVHLAIVKVDGDTILTSPNFIDINEQGLGSIILPVTDFSEGHYMLHASPSDSAAASDRLYMFRVK